MVWSFGAPEHVCRTALDLLGFMRFIGDEAIFPLIGDRIPSKALETRERSNRPVRSPQLGCLGRRPLQQTPVVRTSRQRERQRVKSRMFRCYSHAWASWWFQRCWEEGVSVVLWMNQWRA